MLRTISFFVVIILLLSGVLYGIMQNRSQIINQEDSKEEVFIPEEITENVEEKIEEVDRESEIESPVVVSLEDYVWVWKQTVMNKDDDVTNPNKPGVFSLTFEDGRVFGKTDCNNFSGGYKIENERITFEPFMSTLMYCEESQEGEFMKMVSDSTSFMFDQNGNLILLIKYDSGSVLFEKE